jgi:hypothetical protein
MGYIEDVQSLLEKKSNTTYVELLELLISLEREHSARKVKIALGVRSDIEELCHDMEIVWKIGEIASRVRLTIEKKLNE